MTSNTAIYGVGPTAPHVDTRPAWQADFVRDVAATASGPWGGTYGAPAGRYVVGGWFAAVVLTRRATSSVRASHAVEFLSGREFGPGDGVGFWTDDNGRVWLDVVRVTDNPRLAAHWAELNGELAYFDRDNDAVITL